MHACFISDQQASEEIFCEFPWDKLQPRQNHPNCKLLHHVRWLTISEHDNFSRFPTFYCKDTSVQCKRKGNDRKLTSTGHCDASLFGVFYNCGKFAKDVRLLRCHSADWCWSKFSVNCCTWELAGNCCYNSEEYFSWSFPGYHLHACASSCKAALFWTHTKKSISILVRNTDLVESILHAHEASKAQYVI